MKTRSHAENKKRGSQNPEIHLYPSFTSEETVKQNLGEKLSMEKLGAIRFL